MSLPLTGPRAAAGPLVVSKRNPRYFAISSDPDQRAVYLTGSHIWNSLQDGLGFGKKCAENPERFDYAAYLEFLKARGHNFIRLWRWENFRSLAPGGAHLCMAPQPWPRTGVGIAKDGKPKFDLSTFDRDYFDRLRDRIIAAGNEGIYVSVMLFDGWALHLSRPPHNVEGHPFHGDNNVNGIDVRSLVDYQVLPLESRVKALEEAYIRKVVETVHDLPNVLYEVANESSGGGSISRLMALMIGMGPRRHRPEWGDSTEWQYWVIDVVQKYERLMGYEKHPIGMTMQFPVADQTKVNEPLMNSRADWISPGYDDEAFKGGKAPMMPFAPQSRWFVDPPASSGKKVVITDTDHYVRPGKGDALWAWKSFLRGHHPIFMDFGLIDGANPPDRSKKRRGIPSFDSLEPARYAMGDTLRYARKMNLIAMEPRADVSSTGYALANPGKEYLVLQPSEGGEAFTVSLLANRYRVEWYSVKNRATIESEALAVQSGGMTFQTPFAEGGPAVLYLNAA